MRTDSQYNIGFLNLFDLNLKRGQLANIHSLMLYLYYKSNGSDTVHFKYSMVTWMSLNTTLTTLDLMAKLGLIVIIERPTKKQPCLIQLRTSDDLAPLLNIKPIPNIDEDLLAANDLKLFIGCSNLRENFEISQINTWIRNVNNKVWDRNKLLVILLIISKYNIDIKIKTAMVSKYMTMKSFTKSIGYLLNLLPSHNKDEIQTRINTFLGPKAPWSHTDSLKQFIKGSKI